MKWRNNIGFYMKHHTGNFGGNATIMNKVLVGQICFFRSK